MKESISYTFLLNIIIIFIFTCFAIIMGIFSYYKAFRANTIISSAIEKYEGYNCASKEEIERNLNTISYNTPFKVTCNNKGSHCTTNEAQTYAVISYNLDFDYDESSSKNGILHTYNDGEIRGLAGDNNMNSPYDCSYMKLNGEEEKKYCVTNKHYQYGIYTYMYVELPVISSLLRIPFFSKTSIMYEFRNLYVEKSPWTGTFRISDANSMFKSLYNSTKSEGKVYISDNIYGKIIATEDENGNEKYLENGSDGSDKISALSYFYIITTDYAKTDLQRKTAAATLNRAYGFSYRGEVLFNLIFNRFEGYTTGVYDRYGTTAYPTNEVYYSTACNYKMDYKIEQNN